MPLLRVLPALILLAATVAPADGRSADGACAVEPCGYGGGGRFTTLAIDPHDPQAILAGSDVAGIFKSTDGLFLSADGGRTFEPVPLDLPRVSINDILIAAEGRSGIYVGFNGIGPFRLVEQ